MKVTYTELQQKMRGIHIGSEDKLEELVKSLPLEVTWEGVVMFKVVPRQWRNPAFPIH